MTIEWSWNPYLIGSLILLGIWVLTLGLVKVFRPREELREFWWGSLFCGLFGTTEPLFVPEYWDPPSILKWGRLDLESFLFCFAIGGITAVFTELPLVIEAARKIDYVVWRLVRGVAALLPPRPLESPGPELPVVSRSRVVAPRDLSLENVLLVTFSLAVFGTTAQLNLNILYDAAIMCVATALFISWRRPRLRWQIIGGAVTFTVLYGLVLAIMDELYPTFYTDYWNLDALSGFWIGGAPVEEYLFAASFGAFWAPMYEAVREQSEAIARGGKREHTAPMLKLSEQIRALQDEMSRFKKGS